MFSIFCQTCSRLTTYATNICFVFNILL